MYINTGVPTGQHHGRSSHAFPGKSVQLCVPAVCTHSVHSMGKKTPKTEKEEVCAVVE